MVVIHKKLNSLLLNNIIGYMHNFNIKITKQIIMNNLIHVIENNNETKDIIVKLLLKKYGKDKTYYHDENYNELIVYHSYDVIIYAL